ncbi:glycine cleavage system protein H [Aureliella helgolandensis]|uniref:Glycine cleavage system H protein n=1 Tax=Aureliella helgolandensis TaxID=2527968 RepID=A0A518G8Q7_9BACT|nr:glycine cleavage system protein H [Aureliella helgolandensis]QDV24962.1 Glycine cleavage system H protein [Aureliella helgolandensis]
MSAELVFMMGDFEARFPTDRRYAKNHMWAAPLRDGIWRLGLTAYAVRLLQDVYFLDLVLEAEMRIGERQEIGSIESKKAESSLYTPVAGTVVQTNADLLHDPTGINLDKYGQGWMYEIAADAESAASRLLSPEDYLEHLTAAWEVAQRTIKGQANA